MKLCKLVIKRVWHKCYLKILKNLQNQITKNIISKNYAIPLISIELLNRATIFCNGVFQNNYFKKLISQETYLKYTCLKCLFFNLIDWAFVALCAWLWSKNKRKQPLTVNINKKPEILCQNKSNLITLNVKKSFSFLPIAIKFCISWWPLNI